MCIAAPGRVIEVNGRLAKVDILGNVVEVDNMLVSAKKGDDVLIHAGCILEVMTKDTAEELRSLFEELEEQEDENT